MQKIATGLPLSRCTPKLSRKLLYVESFVQKWMKQTKSTGCTKKRYSQQSVSILSVGVWLDFLTPVMLLSRMIYLSYKTRNLKEIFNA